MSTAAQTIDRLYTSGDLLLNNPVQWCVILVSVILASATIQYLMHFLKQNITSKYAKHMNQTTQQEITVVGVVATCLMLATSFLPVDDNQPVYAGLFSWTTMLIFFSAFLYVLEIICQYYICNADMLRWRQYEERRLDSDDVDRLVLRERHYRLAFDRFAEELKIAFQITTRECPLHENAMVFHKRFLARMTDFSYRCWLSLSIVVLCNFGRTYFSPYETPLDDYENFMNALVFMGCTGWFVLVVFGVYTFILFRCMSDLVNKRLKRSTVGAEIVPFWDPIRATEFLQCVYLSLNYFMTVFVLGIANTINGSGYIAATAFLFALPIIIVMLATPWVLWSLSIMSVLGSVRKNRPIIQNIVREARGQQNDKSDDEDEYSDLDEDDRPQGDAVLDRMAAKRGMRPKSLRSSRPLISEAETEAHERSIHRPLWVDDDEAWDGKAVRLLNVAADAEGHATNDVVDANTDFLYYNNVDGDDFDRVAMKLAPELVAGRDLAFGNNSSLHGTQPRASAGARSSDGGKGRPSWAESDEEFDI